MTGQSVAHQTRIGIACPHCSGATRVRSSRSDGPTFRQAYLQCTDVECGFTFAIAVEVTHGISPSAKPNPALQHLRMAPPRRRAANDRHPERLTGPEVPAAPANDDGAMGETLAL